MIRVFGQNSDVAIVSIDIHGNADKPLNVLETPEVPLDTLAWESRRDRGRAMWVRG
jgi:hypothetical protein